MRAATRTGAPRATLRYAAQVRAVHRLGNPRNTTRSRHGRLSREGLFRRRGGVMKVLRAKNADAERRRLPATASSAPITSSNCLLDQLWAAFEAASVVADAGGGWFEVDFDASYLLDVQLSDSQFEEYLERYANAPAVVFKKSPVELRRESSSPFTRSSLEAVRYELAVRHARREEYADAATLYDGLRSPRASRMRRAETLLAATIVQEAGATPLGRKAAARALFCLRRISTERFGRSQDIRAADIRLSEWLARGRQLPNDAGWTHAP